MNDSSKPTVATNAEFTSAGGDVLLVANGAETFHIITGPRGPSLLFPHTDAPAIALAILTAAGVTPESEHYGLVDDPARSLRVAAHYLTVHAGQTQRAAELTRRRDALAETLSGVIGTQYGVRNRDLRAAIDMIIQLQDEATK